MKRKNILKIAIFIGLLISALLCINCQFVNTRHSNFSLVMTIIFGYATYYYLKDFSRRIAFGSIVLLFIIYSLFDMAFDKHSEHFFRMAILITQTSILIFTYFCGTITRKKTTKRIKQEVSKYVSSNVLEKIETEEDTQLSTTGRRENVTIMFLDIRGFTSISEKHTVEEVTTILNDCFREIIPVIKKHNGVINKFIGDAILAVFSGESPKEHAQNAVKAGSEILKRIKNLQHIQETQGKEKINA
jgi:hypothetical protein